MLRWWMQERMSRPDVLLTANAHFIYIKKHFIEEIHFQYLWNSRHIDTNELQMYISKVISEGFLHMNKYNTLRCVSGVKTPL